MGTQKETLSSSNKPIEKEPEYYCSFTDYPLGFQKHHWNIVRYGIAHILGSYGLFKLFTFQYPWTMIPFCENSAFKDLSIQDLN